MNRESTLDIARELGSSIQASPEYRGFQTAYENLLEDSRALSLLEEHSKLKDQFKLNAQSTCLGVIKDCEVKLKELENAIDQNSLIQEYYRCQRKYSKLLNNINGVIGHYIENFTLSNQGCNCNKKCHK